MISEISGEIGDNYFIRNIYFCDLIRIFIHSFVYLFFRTVRIVQFDTNHRQWKKEKEENFVRPRFQKKISSNLKIKFLSFMSEISG